MALAALKPRPELEEGSKVNDRYVRFERLLAAAGRHELNNEVAGAVNAEVNELNAITVADRALEKRLEQSWQSVLQVLREKQGLVPRNYHRTTWMALGLAVFGVPLGVSFGISLDNMAFIGIGLPIGLAIGVAVGTSLDRKAAEQGKQLDVKM